MGFENAIKLMKNGKKIKFPKVPYDIYFHVLDLTISYTHQELFKK